MTAISLSTDPESRDNYGPYVPNIGATNPTTGKPIRYNNVADLEEVLEKHGKETAAFIVEPIQGEAGVVVPDEDYLAKVSALCKKHQVLFICDEIQTGIGRTGKLLCHQWAGIKPDLVTLGKAISGGMYPVSVSFFGADWSLDNVLLFEQYQPNCCGEIFLTRFIVCPGRQGRHARDRARHARQHLWWKPSGMRCLSPCAGAY